MAIDVEKSLWDAILDVRAQKGINAKMDTLSNYPELMPYLEAAYNPYKCYGGVVPPEYGYGMSSFFNDDTWDMLDSLAKGKLRGKAAKARILHEYIRLTYSGANMLFCVLNKNFDIGLTAVSINKVFPSLIPEHPIMLAKLVEWDRIKYPCLYSNKLDGLRAVFRNGVFYSRKGHVLLGLTGLTNQLNNWQNLNPNVQLDGELMVPGVHFNEINGKIRSFNETKDAVFHVFDSPSDTGVMEERYRNLLGIFANSSPTNVRLVPHYIAKGEKDIRLAYEEARGDGYEGVMIKDSNELYLNKRSYAWMKVKAVETLDLKVTGLFPGHGKYTGLVGGIYVDFNGVRVGVGSGLTDMQRNLWADNPDEIIGSTVEISFQEVTPDGSLRQPRLTNVRGDK